jgi:hypothetical protein
MRLQRMRISPILPRTQITAIRKTTVVSRSSETIDPEAAGDIGQNEGDGDRPRRRGGQLRAPTGAGNRSSNAVLSALVALQERR